MHYGVRTENKRTHGKGNTHYTIRNTVYGLRNKEYGIRITQYSYVES